MRTSCILAGLMAYSFLGTCDTSAQGRTDENLLFYVGTYTGGKSKGIYAFRIDAKGKVTTLGLAGETASPTFLAVHPNKKVLYAVGEISNFDGKKNSGAVSAWAIDKESGKLTLLNQQPSGGGGPCHLAVDATGKTLLVANYGGGSISALPVREDGSLGEAASFIQHQGGSVDQRRQQGPHAHFITTDPANRFAITCDLGLDQVLVYRLDAAKSILTPNDPPFVSLKPGAGPRHLAFHPNGRFVYVINEMGSTMTVFAWQADRGALKEVQTVPTLPSDFTKSSTTAEVEVHPNGKFVYGSNRGHDSIVVFAADPETGKLTFVEHQSTQGKTPRHFTLTPRGDYMIAENQDTDNFVVFKVDQATGRLTPTGQSVEVGRPVCIKFVPGP